MLNKHPKALLFQIVHNHSQIVAGVEAEDHSFIYPLLHSSKSEGNTFMNNENKRPYIYSPDWPIIIILGIISIICRILCEFGVGREASRYVELNVTSWLAFIVMLTRWKCVYVYHEYILTIRCSVFKKKTCWEDVERIELLKYKSRMNFLLIEKRGCPPCPDKQRYVLGDLFLIRHSSKLIKVKLNAPIEEGISAIEKHHPIDRVVEWTHSI